MTAHTADAIIEAMARALDPKSWGERDEMILAEGTSWRTDEIVLGSITLARAAYAECLRMLINGMPDDSWQERDVMRALIRRRQVELGSSTPG